jgi:hypothetical protein
MYVKARVIHRVPFNLMLLHDTLERMIEYVYTMFCVPSFMIIYILCLLVRNYVYKRLLGGTSIKFLAGFIYKASLESKVTKVRTKIPYSKDTKSSARSDESSLRWLVLRISSKYG